MPVAHDLFARLVQAFCAGWRFHFHDANRGPMKVHEPRGTSEVLKTSPGRLAVGAVTREEIIQKRLRFAALATIVCRPFFNEERQCRLYLWSTSQVRILWVQYRYSSL